MANVLLTWELGGGLGHLVNLRPLAKGLAQRGHRIFVALKELTRADHMLETEGLRYIQAPFRTRPVTRRITPPRTFAEILWNIGFGEYAEMRILAAAWQSVFEFVAPDLIVFDHSPTALLAARAINAKRALIGTGFFCPRDEYPLSDLSSPSSRVSEESQLNEDLILQFANRLLNSWGMQPLDRISQLYHDVDEHFLVSFKELDHYGAREEQRYWGAWPNVGGKKVVWPQGNGARIYAYLKPFAALPNLLAILRELRCPTVVYVDGISAAIQKRFASKSLQFEAAPLDLAQGAAECDLAILNGNHGTTVSMLLAGKPTLQIPLFLEQGLFSRAVEKMGAALIGLHNRGEQITLRLLEMLSSDRFTKAAAAFAARYSAFDPSLATRDLVDRADELLSEKN